MKSELEAQELANCIRVHSPQILLLRTMHYLPWTQGRMEYVCVCVEGGGCPVLYPSHNITISTMTYFAWHLNITLKYRDLALWASMRQTIPIPWTLYLTIHSPFVSPVTKPTPYAFDTVAACVVTVTAAVCVMFHTVRHLPHYLHTNR